MRKVILLSLLLAVTLCVQDASAAIAGLINLPPSSYAISVDNWQGYSIYNNSADGFINLRIDFAVYDVDMIEIDTDEWLFYNELFEDYEITGRFIYAYQVFQPTYLQPGDTTSVGYFGILDSTGQTISGTDVNALDDDQPYAQGTADPGQAPDESINDPISWTWNENPLVTREHSWFLVYSSNFEPVIGGYEVREPVTTGAGGDFPIDGGGTPVPPETPEPATLILLGIGGAMVFAKRRRSV